MLPGKNTRVGTREWRSWGLSHASLSRNGFELIANSKGHTMVKGPFRIPTNPLCYGPQRLPTTPNISTRMVIHSPIPSSSCNLFTSDSCQNLVKRYSTIVSKYWLIFLRKSCSILAHSGFTFFAWWHTLFSIEWSCHHISTCSAWCSWRRRTPARGRTPPARRRAWPPR